MKFDDKIPIYYQIKLYLYREVLTGKLKPGDKLPPVRQLAVDLTVNVNTVQRALTEMIAEKTIISQRGKGNFVTEDQAALAQLKEQLVMTQLAQLYDQLHRLNLSDAEIVASLQRYIDQKEAQRDVASIND